MGRGVPAEEGGVPAENGSVDTCIVTSLFAPVTGLMHAIATAWYVCYTGGDGQQLTYLTRREGGREGGAALD